MQKGEYLSNEHLTFWSMQMILSCFVSPICMLAEVSYIYYYGIGSHESVGMYLCYDGAEFRRTRNNEEK